MIIPDNYYAHVWPLNLWLPKAIALYESAENPLAVGDEGKAIGLFQLHWDFIVTWAAGPSIGRATDPGMIAIGHWSPGTWALAVRNFLTHYYDLRLKIEPALRIYHYGHDESNDPDLYVAGVKASSRAGRLTW